MKKHLLWLCALLCCLSASAQSVVLPNNGAEAVCPVLPGTELPDATLRNQEGNEVQLREIVDGKAVVLLICRGGWCPYCNRHLAGVREIEGELQEMGYTILAISPDSPESMGEMEAKKEFGFTLLSDSDMELSTALGLTFEVDEKTLKRYKLIGIDVETASGRDHHRLPVPAAIVVDKKGVIRFVYANPNYKDRVDPEVLKAAASAALD